MDFIRSNLNILNEELTKNIKDGVVPFVGYYISRLDGEIQHSLNEDMNQHFNRIDGVLCGLNKYPAIYALFLLKIISEKYGSTGKGRAWPYIAESIGVPLSSFSNSSQEDLWLAFRTACRQLGLEVVAHKKGHYKVEEFLKQSGIPNAYIDRVLQLMIEQERDLGVPNLDEQEHIEEWSQELALKAERKNLPKPVQIALKNDEQGFYAEQYAICKSGVTGDSRNEFLSALNHALENLPLQKNDQKSEFKTVQLVWRENRICVIVPSGNDVEWVFETHNEKLRVRGGKSPQEVELPDEQPEYVVISSSRRKSKRTVPLWVDSATNRFLVFDSSQKFVKSCQLEHKLEADDESSNLYLIKPGNCSIISRFELNLNEFECESIGYDDGLFETHVDINPGQQLVVNRASAQTILEGKQVILIVAKGTSWVDGAGTIFYRDSDLLLEIMFPKEDYSTKNDFNVFMVDVSIDGGDPIQVESIVAEEKIHVAIAEILIKSNVENGLRHLRLGLKRKGFRRNVGILNLLVWFGLEDLEKGVLTVAYNSWPTNLVRGKQANILEDFETRTFSPKNINERYFTLTFSCGKEIELRFVTPGVFCSILKSIDGQRYREPLPLGWTLAVDSSDQRFLEIASGVDGDLLLDDFCGRTHHGRLRISLAYLAANVSAASDQLYYKQDTGKRYYLGRLVLSQEVLSFSLGRDTNKQTSSFQFEIPEALDAVQIVQDNLATGILEDTTLGKSSLVPEKSTTTWVGNAWMVEELGLRNDFCGYRFIGDFSEFDDGVYVIDLKLNLKGRWGWAKTQRGDRCSLCYTIVDGKCQGGFSPYFGIVKNIDDITAMKMWAHCHKVLRRCYEDECWRQQISDIKDYWIHLTKRWVGSNNIDAAGLISGLSEPIPADTSSSWIPLVCAATEAPWLYCFPSLFYSTNESFQNHLGAALHGLGLLPSIINPNVESCLSSPTNVWRAGLDSQNYYINQILHSVSLSDEYHAGNWRISAKELLGKEHLETSLELARQRWNLAKDGSSSIGGGLGNRFRRPNAERFLLRFSKARLSSFSKDLPPCMSDLFEPKIENFDWSEDEHRIMSQLFKFLYLVSAGMRLESRIPGIWETMEKRMLDLFDEKQNLSNSTLSYLFEIGDGLFGFCLLLNEFSLKKFGDTE